MRHTCSEILDANHSDPDTPPLHELDADRQIAVTCHQDRVRDGVARSQLKKVGHDQRIDTLLLALAIDRTRTELNVVHVTQGALLLRRPVCQDTVVPVHAQ